LLSINKCPKKKRRRAGLLFAYNLEDVDVALEGGVVECVVAAGVGEVGARVRVQDELPDHVAVLVAGAGEHEGRAAAGVEEAGRLGVARHQTLVPLVHLGAVVDEQLRALEVGAHARVVQRGAW